MHPRKIMTLGEILTQLKEKHNLKVSEMAEMSGVTRYYIDKYLVDTHANPSTHKVQAIANGCFDVNVGSVLAGTDDTGDGRLIHDSHHINGSSKLNFKVYQEKTPPIMYEATGELIGANELLNIKKDYNHEAALKDELDVNKEQNQQ